MWKSSCAPGMSILSTVVFLLIFLEPQSAWPVSHARIRSYNVGCQAVFTLISGFIEGKARSRSDIVSCLLGGAAAGYGFHASKNMAGKGQVMGAVILANVSASLAENVSLGHHPFSYMGYSLGPVRFRCALPWTKNPRARINVDLSITQTVALAYSFLEYRSVSFRDGLIFFKTDTLHGEYDGETNGMFPALSYGAGPLTWRHETVHAIQALQIDAIEPSRILHLMIPFGVTDAQSSQVESSAIAAVQNKDKTRFIGFGRVKNGIFYGINALLLGSQRYEDRWVEIEAYHFAK